jgi:DNA-directed RNA polymerase subunit RPC12/RpoP
MSGLYRCTLCGHYSEGPGGLAFIRCDRCTGAIMLPERGLRAWLLRLIDRVAPLVPPAIDECEACPVTHLCERPKSCTRRLDCIQADLDRRLSKVPPC